MSDQPIHLELDVNRFTLAELEDLEEATGMSFVQLGERLQSGDYPIKLLRALVWILRRRTDPGFTLEDARELSLGDIRFQDEAPHRPAKRGGARPPG